jgi:hypothetical protein
MPTKVRATFVQPVPRITAIPRHGSAPIETGNAKLGGVDFLNLAGLED